MSLLYRRGTLEDSHSVFFVSPPQQSSGVGRELLSRAFSKSGARYRTIIATLDERALYRYMKLGVYERDGNIVGYGYAGPGTGPFALLDENDFPAVLAHAESLMAERGEEFGAEAPLLNEKAIQYFVERKYQIDSFSAIFMSNAAFGKFQNYLCFSPEFFM